jgi:hypothetical protein
MCAVHVPPASLMGSIPQLQWLDWRKMKFGVLLAALI